jgi:hypothetical protein
VRQAGKNEKRNQPFTNIDKNGIMICLAPKPLGFAKRNPNPHA